MTAESNAIDVQYREFEQNDYQDLARITGEVWPGEGSAMGGKLGGAVYLATFLQRSTYSQVAVANGKPAGFIFARDGDPNPKVEAAWKGVEQESIDRLRRVDPREADHLLAGIEAETKAYDKVLRESGCDTRYEFVLFAVSPSAQGLGVGRELFSRAELYLYGRGAREAYLETDDSCDWSFYEHRGLRRAAEYHPSSRQNGLLLSGYYIYVDELKLDC